MRSIGICLVLAASLCATIAVRRHSVTELQPGEEFRYTGECVITTIGQQTPDYRAQLSEIATVAAQDKQGQRVLRFRMADSLPMQPGMPAPPSDVEIWSCRADPEASMRPSPTKLTPGLDMVDCLSLPQPLGPPDGTAVPALAELPVFNQSQMSHVPIYVRRKSLGMESILGRSCIHFERVCATTLPVALSVSGQLLAYHDQFWIDRSSGILVKYEGTATLRGIAGVGTSQQRITNTLSLASVKTLALSELRQRAAQEHALETIAKSADSEALISSDQADPSILEAAQAQLAHFSSDAPASPYLPAAHSLEAQVQHALASVRLTRKQALLVGQPAPDVTLQDLNGRKRALTEYRGKIVLLTFFASWCGPCNDEAPQVEVNVWQKRRDRGVVVVGIDTREEGHFAAQASAFRARHRLTYPILCDESGAAAQAFEVQAIPVNVVIDRGGVVRYVKTGYDPDAVDSALDSLERQQLR